MVTSINTRRCWNTQDSPFVCMPTHSMAYTWSDNYVRKLATTCLPWQHWTKALVWFDDVDISMFHSCVIVDLWESLSEWHLLLYACVLVCCSENVGTRICQDLLERQDNILGMSSQVMKHGSANMTLKQSGKVHNRRLPIPHDQKKFLWSKSRVKTMLLTFF